MWFILALVAIFFWSGSDLFTKMGSDKNEKYTQWKIVIAVGLVMGRYRLLQGWQGKLEVTNLSERNYKMMRLAGMQALCTLSQKRNKEDKHE